MPTARCCLTAAFGGDGRLYAIGGVLNGTGAHRITSIVEAFDPGSNRWSSAAPLPEARSVAASAEGLDGRIYVFGGSDGINVTAPAPVDIFEPRTKTWSTGAPMPTPRTALAAVAARDGRIYVLGGVYAKRPVPDQPANFTIRSDVDVYTPKTDTWTTVAAMTLPRSPIAAAAAADGRIYVLGGVTYGDAPDHYIAVTNVEAYSPDTNSWSAVASMPTSLNSHAAAADRDGRVYVIGGNVQSGQCVASMDVYSASTNSWVSGPSMASGRCSVAAATGPDGRLYVVGGVTTHFDDVNSLEIFSPAAG